MAEPRAEKRGTLRGPPSFRVRTTVVSADAHGSRSSERARTMLLFTSGQANVCGSMTSSHNGRIRFGDVDRRPLAAPTEKERFMHNPQDPSRITNSYPYKTPAERVHDSDGRVHDETTNSPSPMRRGTVEPAKCQLKGFMVPGSGVHDCRIAATIAGPAQLELNAAGSWVRSPAPSMRRTSGEPIAAARRPERWALLGIALRSPSFTWWGRYSVTSLGQQSLEIADARLPRRPRLFGINPFRPDRTRRKDGEPVGLAVSLARAAIMKVAARHEAHSKMDDPLGGSWWGCRWLSSALVPESFSGSLRWQT